MDVTDNLRVLQLTTSREVFFNQQIETLEEKGVECKVCVVPNAEQIDGQMGQSRGLRDYLHFAHLSHRALRAESYDIIHANYGLTAPFAVTQRRIPVVLTLWGSDVKGIDGLVTRMCASRADAVTVRSEAMRSSLGMEDAIILPSGVDIDRFRPMDRIEARDRVGWKRDGMHVLFPYSPDYERKNYPLAKEVVARTEEEGDFDIQLHTISGVDHEMIPYYINASNCILLTSRYEGSPNTVKESLACNVPVVSTDVGDVNERLTGVEPGGVGKDTRELVAHLLDVLSGTDRSNGRQAVRDLSWDVIGNRILDIYREITPDC